MLVDWAVIGLIYLIAVYCLCRGYYHGHRAWAVKHCLITAAPPRGRAVLAGYKGEAVIAGFAAVAAMVVTFFTDDVSLVGVLERWWFLILPTLVFVYFWIREHARRTVKTVQEVRPPYRPAYVRQVRQAYKAYNFYSLCLFGTGAFILLLLAAQFLHDGRVFAEEAGRINLSFAHARALAESNLPEDVRYAQAVAEAEVGMSRIALSAKLLQMQFNPMFIFAGTLISINMLIRYTRLRGLFTGSAVNMTAIFTYGPLIVIGVIALLIYLNVYEVMLEEALRNLSAFSPPASLGDWALSQRHGQMVAELSNARNIFGFGKAIGGEGGGFAILVWGVQTALDKIAEGKEQYPVRMPFTRFRPDDGRRRSVVRAT